MSLLVFFIFASAHYCYCSQQTSVLPAQVSPAVVQGTEHGICPSLEVMSAQRNVLKQEIRNLLQNTVNPELTNRNRLPPPCSCGGPGEWTRIAFLNMTNHSQQCPTNWNLITSPVRACGRSSTGANTCDSAFFPSNGRLYSHVCGRIIGFQQGTTDAFHASISGTATGLGNAYMDGVSLTHGAAGSQQHIWSFVSALYENDPNQASTAICPCTSSKTNWPHQIPSFVGNNYLCDTGNTGPGYNLTTVYADDPLWDGQGCGPTSTCCQFNNPPWICTTLPEQTSDDIEFRICGNQPRDIDEDTLVNLIDFYIQ